MVDEFPLFVFICSALYIDYITVLEVFKLAYDLLIFKRLLFISDPEAIRFFISATIEYYVLILPKLFL